MRQFWGYTPPKPSVGPSKAPLTSPFPPSNHTITLNLTLTFATGSGLPAMLIRLNKIPEISFMAAFATSLLSILDPNNNSDPSLGLELGLGFGSLSWWNQSWFYNPF